MFKGNVALSYHQDPDFRVEVDNLAFMSKSFPCIYMHTYVNAAGCSPTPNQLAHIITRLRQYCRGEDLDFVHEVDNRRQPGTFDFTHHTSQGVRRYLASKIEPFGQPRQSAIDEITRFCNTLQGRLELLPAEMKNMPLHEPLCEIGFTIEAPKRLAKHSEHKQSTRVMNVVEAVGEVEFGGHQFGMKQMVIKIVGSAREASLAEIFFTRLTQAYTWWATV